MPAPAHHAAATAALTFLLFTPFALAPVSITDPSYCIDDLECGPERYCQHSKSLLQPNYCHPRLQEGNSCKVSRECLSGLFCRTNKGDTRRCARKAGLNARCDPTQFDMCRVGLVCPPLGKKSRCLPPGKAGARCRYDSNCDIRNFFCLAGRCAAKRPHGAKCLRQSVENLECRGLCRETTGWEHARCTEGQPVGGVCTEHEDCANALLIFPKSDSDYIRCNRPRGGIKLGLCTHVSQLIRVLGAPCDVNQDMCDELRALRCRWATHLRKAVCQQRFNSFLDSGEEEFCTPGSKLSSCARPDLRVRTECRTRRRIPGDPNEGVYMDEFRVFRCMKSPTFVPDGTSCDTDDVACGNGAVCRIVPGVLKHGWNRYHQKRPQPPVYCVKNLKKGAACSVSNKFREACAPGLRCLYGKCVRVDQGAQAVKNTHAYEEASCKKLPCAPGFFCNAFKECERITSIVGFGKPCAQSSMLGNAKCKSGMVCRTRWGRNGWLRCGFPQGERSYCQGDEWCKGKLLCPSGMSQGERCYDAAKMLGFGRACDPRTERDRPRCLDVSSRFANTSVRPLRCLPKKGGSFACQKAVREFDSCDQGKGLVCSDAKFECRGGLCLPRK